MMRLLKILPLLLLVGCSEPAIDSRDEETMRSSSVRVREALPDSERQRFDQALLYLHFNLAHDPAPTGPDVSLHSLVNGMTASDVISAAEELRLRILRDQHQETLLSLEETNALIVDNELQLEEEIERVSQARSVLEQIEISRARYFWDNDRYLRNPVIAFRIINGGDIPISRIFIRGRIETPGRSIPWAEEEFNYIIRGGLEPGEQQDLRLAPNRFSGWGVEELINSTDHVLILTLIDVEGPDGERIVGRNISGFGSESEQARLERLLPLLMEQRTRQEAELAALDAEIASLSATISEGVE